MRFKALAIDLDGTLLVGDEVPDANVQALRAARDAGLQVIIATARWSQFALRLADEIGVRGPVIACSGAQVYDPEPAVDVFDHRLPADFVDALFEICNATRCIATITVGDHVQIKMDGEPDAAFLTPEMRWVTQLTRESEDLPRVAAIQGSGCNARIRDELSERFSDRVSILDSIGPTGKIILTITAKQATKGAALSAACDHLAIEPASVVAFGDAENDIDMFRLAGGSVAMGQADEATKSVASFVSKPNYEAGVAHGIERLLARGEL